MSDFQGFGSGQDARRAGAVVDILGSLLGTSGDIGQKISAAEANTQYKAAYETLRKSTTDFNNSLASDPEPEKYMDKWSKAKEQIWANSTRMVKNQDALKALADTWQEMDVKQYEDLSGIQTKARIENTVDTALNSSQKISQDNTRTSDDRKAEIRKIWNPIKAAGMRKSESVDKYITEMDGSIDLNAADGGIRAIAKTQGWDKALSLVGNSDFQKWFPDLKQEDWDALGRKMETQSRWEEQQLKQQIHDGNSKIEDAFSHDLLNGKLTPDAIDKADLKDEPGGRAAGDIRKEWRATILAHPGRGVSDPSTLNNFMKWYYDPDVSHDADATRQKLRDLNSNKSKLTEADYKSIGNDYLALLANPNKNDATMTSETPEWKKMRTQYPQHLDEIDRQENFFMKWRSMNRTASDTEVQDKSKYFQDRVKSKAIDTAIDDMFKAKNTTGGGFLFVGAHYGDKYVNAMKNITNLYASSQAGDARAQKDISELKGLQMLNFANKFGLGLGDFTYEEKGPYIVATVKATGKKYMSDAMGQWQEVQ